MKIRLHLLAMLATAATLGTASANPRMGGGVSVSVPRAPIHYGNPGAGAASAASAAVSSSRAAAEAARAGTGAAVFGPTVGGIENAPRYGSNSVPGSKFGIIIPSFGSAMNNPIGAGAPTSEGGEIHAFGSGLPLPGSDRYYRTSDDQIATDMLIDVANTASIDDKIKKGSNSGSGSQSGSGGKVDTASASSTAVSTPTTSVGSTDGTTRTASLPGDPPDPKKPLTQAEHQALVDRATHLQQETKRFDNQVIDLTELVNRASDGTMTEAQKADLARRGGVDNVNRQIREASDQSRATDKAAKQARQEASDNNSYRHVR